MWIALNHPVSYLKPVKNFKSTKKKSLSGKQLITFGWLVLNFDRILI
jgi:hypothetical protein